MQGALLIMVLLHMVCSALFYFVANATSTRVVSPGDNLDPNPNIWKVGGVIMLLEYPLLFGLYYPLLLPISSIALFLHGAVFHFAIAQGAELQHDTKPSIVYLWVALLLGMMFSIWLFNEADLGGRWLVNIGMPIVTIATTWWTSHTKPQARKIEISAALSELGESLLSPDSQTEEPDQESSASDSHPMVCSVHG